MVTYGKLLGLFHPNPNQPNLSVFRQLLRSIHPENKLTDLTKVWQVSVVRSLVESVDPIMCHFLRSRPNGPNMAHYDPKLSDNPVPRYHWVTVKLCQREIWKIRS